MVKFNIKFDNSRPLTVFDKDFINVLDKQLIHLKYLGEELMCPFFPDINTEIVEIINEADNNRSFALKMFGTYCRNITPNTAENPIKIEFVAPGKFFENVLLFIFILDFRIGFSSAIGTDC